MAFIQLHSDCPQMDTSVPNVFIDNFMPEANGEFVKVYLYLLRCLSMPQADCSISGIADHLDHTEKDVMRALNYWERTKLIEIEYGADKTITGLTFRRLVSNEADYGKAVSDVTPTPVIEYRGDATVVAVKEPGSPIFGEPTSTLPSNTVSDPIPVSTRAMELPVRRQYTASEIQTFQSNEEITEMIFVIEAYFKRNLSSSDLNTIYFWYDELHFSAEMIDYLVQYCISKGHYSMRYMDKVAMNWHESGITSIEEAKENAAIHSQVYYSVMKAFGITSRSLVDSEKLLIDKWSKEMGFSMELILEACSRTMSSIHQPSFEYTDSILTNWQKKKVSCLEDVTKLDAEHEKTKSLNASTQKPQKTASVKPNAFTNFNQRSYDYDALEDVLLNTKVQ